MKERSIFVNRLIIAISGFVCLPLYKYLHSNMQSALADGLLDFCGLVILLFGQYMRISARGYKSEKHLEKSVLITDGPYGFVRHPMYLGGFLIGLGIVVLLLRLWMIPVYLALFFLWYWPQIYNEQRSLLNKFGQRYIDYSKTTPCFFPFLRTLVSFQAQKYFPVKLSWLKKEWNTILVWSLTIVLVEGYEDISSYSFTAFVKEFVFLLLIVFCFGHLLFSFARSTLANLTQAGR